MSESKGIASFLQKDISLQKGLNDTVRNHFYSEFAVLLIAGVDVQRTLDILIQEQTKKHVIEILSDVQDRIVKGKSLADAMKSNGNFSVYEYQSVRIGEETGRLKEVLEYLSVFYEDKVKLRRQLISVFTYPSFVLLITIGILYFMLNYVVPMFEGVFRQFGQELPWLTQKIIFLSENFSLYMGVFVGIVMISTIFFYIQRKEVWFRRYASIIIMKMPVFGILIRKIYLTRFYQSMSLLLSAKTPLVRALQLVEEMINFFPLEEALNSAQNEIRKGRPLAESLSKFSIFDKRTISLITIAEEINKLDSTFDRITQQGKEDIEHRTKVMGTVIQPAIIVIIGVLVGVIMVAMYLPMFNLSNVIQ